MPIPGFQPDGLLPPGVHLATWTEIAVRFGKSPYRQGILSGLLDAARLLAKAKCTRLYIDGSFVTDKVFPGDFDACWDANGVDVVLLDPVFLDFSNRRAAQKARFRGELFISSTTADTTGTTFLSFFQIDKNAGGPKGIVALDLGGLPS